MEVVPEVVGVRRVVLDREAVERLACIDLRHQQGDREDLQLVIFRTVVVARRLGLPGIELGDAEIDVVGRVGTEDHFLVEDERVVGINVPVRLATRLEALLGLRVEQFGSVLVTEVHRHQGERGTVEQGTLGRGRVHPVHLGVDEAVGLVDP